MAKFNHKTNKRSSLWKNVVIIKDYLQKKCSWPTIQKYLQNPLIKNITLVAGGTTIAQAASVLFSPIITRLYGPEKFGALGLFLSIIAILTPIAHLGYGDAIVLPKKDEDGIRLLRASIFFGCTTSIIVLAIIIFFKQAIAKILGLNDDADFLFFIPLVLFFTVIIMVYEYWLYRKKQFKTSSAISIANSLISNGFLVGFGYLLHGNASLIVVNIISQGSYALITFFASRKTFSSVMNKIHGSINLFNDRTHKILHEFRDFPIFRMPQILINTCMSDFPIFLLTILSDPTGAGFFTLCRRVLHLPNLIISHSIGKVLQQRLAQTAQQGASLRPIILKSTISLSAIGIIPYGIVITFGHFLFPFVFGAEWRGAGDYSRWMAILIFFSFINVPSIKAIPLLDLSKLFLFYEIIAAVLRMGGLTFGMLFWKNDLIAIAIYSCIGALLNACLIGYVILVSNNRTRFNIDLS